MFNLDMTDLQPNERLEKPPRMAWSRGLSLKELGYRHSEESRTRISYLRKLQGSTMSIEGREKAKQRMLESMNCPETKKEFSQRMKKRWNDPIQKEKFLTMNVGKKHSEETKKLQSLSNKKAWEKRRARGIINPYVCEHCGKQIVSVNNYNRWHGDNCKEQTA
jgi:hypothetical protein